MNKIDVVKESGPMDGLALKIKNRLPEIFDYRSMVRTTFENEMRRYFGKNESYGEALKLLEEEGIIRIGVKIVAYLNYDR